MSAAKKPMLLSDRLAKATAAEKLEILIENLHDRGSADNAPSVVVNPEASDGLIRTEDYETCIEFCRRLPDGKRLEAAQAWVGEADAMRRVAAADLLAGGHKPNSKSLEGMLDALASLAADADKVVILAALEAFRFFNDEADPAILGRIQERCDWAEDLGVRKAYLEAFPHLSAEDLSPLIRMSRDIDNKVRADACFKLGSSFQFANERMQGPIRQALKARLDDNHPMVRFNAAEGLQSLGAMIDPDVKAAFDKLDSLSADGPMFDNAAFGQLDPSEQAVVQKANHSYMSGMFEAIHASVVADQAANGSRPGSENDWKRAEAAGLLAPDFDARLAAATMAELFELMVIAEKCRPAGDAARRKAYDACWSRTGEERDAAAWDWARTRDMQDLDNLDIVTLFLGHHESRSIIRRPILMAQLDDPNEDVVLEALAELEHHLKHPCEPAVLERLKVFEKHKNRELCLFYVSLFEYPQSADEEAILHRFTYDEDFSIRYRACLGLANSATDNAEIRETLAYYLTADDLAIRWMVIGGLAARNDPRVVDAIAAELKANQKTIDSIVKEDPKLDMWDIIENSPRRRYLADLERWQARLKRHSDVDFILKAIEACKAPTAPV